MRNTKRRDLRVDSIPEITEGSKHASPQKEDEWKQKLKVLRKGEKGSLERK